MKSMYTLLFIAAIVGSYSGCEAIETGSKDQPDGDNRKFKIQD